VSSVEQRVPSTEDEIHCVSDCDDLLCGEREFRDGRFIWYVILERCHEALLDLAKHLDVTQSPLYKDSWIFLLFSKNCLTFFEYLDTNNICPDYVDQQDFISNLNSDVTVHNNDYVGIASYNIFVGIFVATIFGSAFFFDLFWPERQESPSVKLAWKVCSVFACMLTLASALAETVIVARNSAYVTGTDAATAQELLALFGGSPLQYRHNGRAVASVVFEWPGMIATFARYAHSLWLQASAQKDPAGPAKHCCI
jgi:hypothetical protein